MDDRDSPPEVLIDDSLVVSPDMLKPIAAAKKKLEKLEVPAQPPRKVNSNPNPIKAGGTTGASSSDQEQLGGISRSGSALALAHARHEPASVRNSPNGKKDSPKHQHHVARAVSPSQPMQKMQSPTSPTALKMNKNVSASAISQLSHLESNTATVHSGVSTS